MKPKLKDYFDNELHLAKAALQSNNPNLAWRHLERAHILSQSHAWPHVLVHLWMLKLGWMRRDAKEVVGQIARVLVAAPGSWLGRAPLGNTGGANVGIMQVMPIPEDLKKMLSEE